MIQVFQIPGRLLGRNEKESLARSHWAKAAKVKREETNQVAAVIKGARLVPVSCPSEVVIAYCEEVKYFKSGKRKKPRDADNVIDGNKPILDALVETGIIPDDGPDWIKRVIPVVRYQRSDPHITVAIMDYEPNRKVDFPPVDDFSEGDIDG